MNETKTMTSPDERSVMCVISIMISLYEKKYLEPFLLMNGCNHSRNRILVLYQVIGFVVLTEKFDLFFRKYNFFVI